MHAGLGGVMWGGGGGGAAGGEGNPNLSKGVTPADGLAAGYAVVHWAVT